MKRNRKQYGIFLWLVAQSLFLILAAFLSFLFVLLIAKTRWNTGDGFSVGYAFLTVVPLCLLLGALNFFLARYTQKRISALAKGIRGVAQGHFEVRLKEEDAGPFYELYHNFNQMGAELEQVGILREDFANSYSHEFKTPITSIQGFASLLLEQEVSAEERRMYLTIIRDESARLSHLANNTILLARLESQQIITEKEIYPLTEQIRRCVATLSPAWSEKQLTINALLEETDYYGNPALMHHLWLNLISNAVKFTPEHGTVTITLKKFPTEILAAVSDTGPGMNLETQAHIFEKYYRSDASHSRQGLGLGLSICRRITQLCGGSLRVESRPQKGATFTVTLPVLPQPESMPASSHRSGLPFPLI